MFPCRNINNLVCCVIPEAITTAVEPSTESALEASSPFESGTEMVVPSTSPTDPSSAVDSNLHSSGEPNTDLESITDTSPLTQSSVLETSSVVVPPIQNTLMEPSSAAESNTDVQSTMEETPSVLESNTEVSSVQSTVTETSSVHEPSSVIESGTEVSPVQSTMEGTSSVPDPISVVESNTNTPTAHHSVSESVVRTSEGIGGSVSVFSSVNLKTSSAISIESNTGGLLDFGSVTSTLSSESFVSSHGTNQLTTTADIQSTTTIQQIGPTETVMTTQQPNTGDI